MNISWKRTFTQMRMLLYLRPTFYSLELLACLLRNKHRFLEIFHEKKKSSAKCHPFLILTWIKYPFK